MKTAYIHIRTSSWLMIHEETNRYPKRMILSSYEEAYNHIRDLLLAGWNLKFL